MDFIGQVNYREERGEVSDALGKKLHEANARGDKAEEIPRAVQEMLAGLQSRLERAEEAVVERDRVITALLQADVEKTSAIIRTLKFSGVVPEEKDARSREEQKDMLKQIASLRGDLIEKRGRIGELEAEIKRLNDELLSWQQCMVDVVEEGKRRLAEVV